MPRQTKIYLCIFLAQSHCNTQIGCQLPRVLLYI